MMAIVLIILIMLSSQLSPITKWPNLRVVWGHPNVFSQLFASTWRVVCKHACASTRHYCTLVSDYLLKTWVHTHTHSLAHARKQSDGRTCSMHKYKGCVNVGLHSRIPPHHR